MNAYIYIYREREREETWKVEEVERKRVEKFPPTKAEDEMPDKIPKAEALRFSAILSACKLTPQKQWEV